MVEAPRDRHDRGGDGDAQAGAVGTHAPGAASDGGPRLDEAVFGGADGRGHAAGGDETARDASLASVDDLTRPVPLRDPSQARVLILNASFEPLHVCSVRRAVNLLLHDVVERVEDAGHVLRTPSTDFPVPSVVRLKRYVRRPHRQRVAFNRRNVFRRDDQRCQYCGERVHDLTLDHVVPRSRGGPTSWENVVACCRPCNARKRDRTPEEARMALRRLPVAPAFLFSAAYGIMPDVDPAWLPYLPAASRR